MTAVGSSAEDNNRNLSSHNIEVQQFYLQMIKKKIACDFKLDIHDLIYIPLLFYFSSY